VCVRQFNLEVEESDTARAELEPRRKDTTLPVVLEVKPVLRVSFWQSDCVARMSRVCHFGTGLCYTYVTRVSLCPQGLCYTYAIKTLSRFVSFYCVCCYVRAVDLYFVTMLVYMVAFANGCYFKRLLFVLLPGNTTP
jgi:hypothetical protein